MGRKLRRRRAGASALDHRPREVEQEETPLTAEDSSAEGHATGKLVAMFSVDIRDGLVTLSDTDTPSAAVLAPGRGGMLRALPSPAASCSTSTARPSTIPPPTCAAACPSSSRRPASSPATPGPAGGAHGRDEAARLRAERRLGGRRARAATARGDAYASAPSDATRAQFPWEFARYAYRLRGRGAARSSCASRTAATSRCRSAGFHPYFSVRDADKARARIPTARDARLRQRDRSARSRSRASTSRSPRSTCTCSTTGLRGALALGDGDASSCGLGRVPRWVVWTLRGRTSCASSRGPPRRTRSTPATACSRSRPARRGR